MRKILALVEGQTEEIFVRDVLEPHLMNFDACVVPVLLKTKRVKSGGAFRGGVTSTTQVLGDIRRLLGDTSAAVVTTILDYYGLPADFPGMTARPPFDPYARVAGVETALAEEFSDRRFQPHLVLHEYEAWIYSDPDRCAHVLQDPARPDATLAARLKTTRDSVGGPEHIDENPASAPSKRLQQAFPGYQKTFHGPLAVGAVGLAALRAACPHAHGWLAKLEGK